MIMTHAFSRRATLNVCLPLLLLAVPPLWAEAPPLVLAEAGQTDYVIILAADAPEGEAWAARELASYLQKMSGAVFPVRRDDTPPTPHEIVLGETNRKALADLPDELRSENMEAFAIVCEDERLLIMGNLPRGTLYGVYDFLDIELGVRFLAHKVDHVPSRPTLKVEVASRVYAPLLERRTIWEGSPMGEALLRQRMNGTAFQVIAERILGGVKMVGRPTHTFSAFVSQEKYFDEHPEYFAFIEGERRRNYNGVISQLCLTNPDVLLISMEVIRSWLTDAQRDNPYNKYIVSVSANDSPYHCRCEVCQAVNAEEGVGQGAGGPHVRFLNAIAREVAQEFPNASLKTMFYQSDLPKKTKAAPNVIVECVTGVDWRYPLDDMSRHAVRHMVRYFDKFLRTAGDGSIYVWTKHNEFSDYFIAKGWMPNPGLWELPRNIRIMTDQYRVKGMFAQNSQTAASDFQALRYYLLSRAMWRPTIDARKEIEEFCHLYYGAAAPDVLRHIASVHEDYLHPDPPEGEELPRMTRTEKERYIATSGRILASAEAHADGPAVRLRVATLRLPVWKMMLNLAFEDAKGNPDYVAPDDVRTAGLRFIGVGRAARLTHISESYGGPHVQTEVYYRRVRELLCRGRLTGPSDFWIDDDHALADADLSQVRRLDLCRADVTDVGAAHLRDATRLEVLDLRYTQVTDEGLSHLAGLVNLRELQLGGHSRNAGKKITSEGVSHLANLTALKKLGLGGTNIDSSCVAVVAQMQDLEHLVLSQTHLDVDAIATLAQLPELKALELFNARLNDEGMRQLHHLSKLRYLYIYDNFKVTDGAVSDLQNALPNLYIRQD